MHYARVHPDLWSDRLHRLAAMGVNTVETYVMWNFHQPAEATVDFAGWRDVAAFVRLAGAVGLDVIVRPGPYVCAEWEAGGLPAWLRATPGIRLRCADPAYLAAVDRWFDALIPQLTPLQASHGGPIVACQIENEYGSYGNDAGYLQHLADGLQRRGMDCLLFTSDGPTEPMLQGGTLPGVLATVNFGSRADEAFDLLAAIRPGQPLLCMEFWHGWFDHWGEDHHTRPPADAAGELETMLARGGSVNLYVGHGGTSFGWWAGANHTGTDYQPSVTSYDYDAPIDEGGRVTEKFHRFREVIARHLPVPDVPTPVDPQTLAPQAVAPVAVLALRDVLGGLSSPVRRPAPAPMEELGQSFGLIHYRTEVTGPRPEAALTVVGLADRAHVFVDGVLRGVLDRNGPTSLPVAIPADGAEIEILVEAMGRVNYGPHTADRKGITDSVRLDYQHLFDWEIRSLPLDEVGGLPWSTGGSTAAGPTLHRVELLIGAPADGWIALPGWEKGCVWLNGFQLGRYWSIGPQRALYAPAPLWREGSNEVIVLELDRPGDAVELRDQPDLG